ncbi:MAG: hypothetical protein M3040_05870 [Bacteroidota bacterium]|nr:hypothetical protein [Bacteroidota bacterium]
MKILFTFLIICFIINTNNSFAVALSERHVNKHDATKAINSIEAIEFQPFYCIFSVSQWLFAVVVH